MCGRSSSTRISGDTGAGQRGGARTNPSFSSTFTSAATQGVAKSTMARTALYAPLQNTANPRDIQIRYICVVADSKTHDSLDVSATIARSSEPRKGAAGQHLPALSAMERHPAVLDMFLVNDESFLWCSHLPGAYSARTATRRRKGARIRPMANCVSMADGTVPWESGAKVGFEPRPSQPQTG